MNLEKIQEILRDDFPQKKERILYSMSEDPSITEDLIKIISYDRVRKTEALGEASMQLSRIHFYLTKLKNLVKEEKKQTGLTRRFLIEELKLFYQKYEGLVLHSGAGTVWGEKYLKLKSTKERVRKLEEKQ